MKWKKFYFAFAMTFIFVYDIMGQQRLVPDTYSSIQSAIDAATDGDTVLVAEGTYYENINYNGKAITVGSQFIIDGDESHIENTIIDGSQYTNELKASVVTIENVPTSKATLKGLTITGGSGTYLSAYQAYFGGGILIFNSGAIVESNVIRNNKIEKPDCGMPGIAAAPGEEDSIIIRDNRVVHNEVISTKMASGGGIALNLLAKNALVRINDNFVSYNKVTTSGLYKVVGGGLYIATEYSYGSDIQVYNNIITNNELHCQSSFGGGIYVVYPYDHVTPLTSTQVRIFNNIISNNYSQDKGGGIGVWNMAKYLNTNLNYPPDPIITNNTITDNIASDGSGIFNYDATTVLMNNIIWDSIQNEKCREIYNYNFSGQYCFPSPPRWCTDLNRGILYAYNNDIKEGWENINENWIGQNNINSDPMLNPETFELLEGSPCIGTGTDSVQIESVWYKTPLYDFNDSIRPHPIDQFVDIGAIESPYLKYDNSNVLIVPGEYTTIQNAIDAADSGNVVLVSEGTYIENINYKGKAITVASHFFMDGDTSHISKTIIDGSQPNNPDSASVVSMTSGEDTTSVLCGFTITHGNGTYHFFDGVGHARIGGGINSEAGGKIEHNIIIQNNPDLSDREYYGVYGLGIAAVSNGQYFIMRNNIITENKYNGPKRVFGVGVVTLGGPMLIEKNTISNNEGVANTEADGGAICYFQNQDFPTSDVNKITIRNNRLTGNKIVSTQVNAHGGAILLRGFDVPADIKVYNNIIDNNTSSGRGGGISVWACSPVICNNTIYNNSAPAGNQLWNTLNGTPNLFNNIIWSDSNVAEIEKYDGTITVKYCCVRGGYTGEGNFNFDPMLDSETFDLLRESPCIGTGSDSVSFNNTWYYAPLFDLYSNARPHRRDSMVDVGALESRHKDEFAPHILSRMKIGDAIQLKCSEGGLLYCVLSGTPADATKIEQKSLLDPMPIIGNITDKISIADLHGGIFWLYLIDKSGNISEPWQFEVQATWQEMASMDIARHDPATCIIDNKIYVFGGFTSINSATASVKIYNTETNEWKAAADMDQAKVPSSSDTINQKIYISGGQIFSNNTWQPIDINQEYNHETDSYADKKNTPIPIGFGSTCTHNGLIYKFGGFANIGENVKNAWKYDPANDTWNTISDMNFEHGVSTAQVVNGKMYVIGGIEGNPNLGTGKTTGKVEMYNPQYNTWTENEDLPYPVSGHKSIVHNDMILVFGGENTNYIQQYNPAKNTWRIMQRMPFKRSPAAVQKIGKYAYIIGGIGSNWDNFYSDVWRFNLDFLEEECEGLSITVPTEEFKVGEEYTFSADVLPADFANKAIIWSSANEEVATVSASGIVSCVAEGTVTITAQLKYGSCYDSYPIEILPTGIDKHKEGYLTITPNSIKATAFIETSAGNLIRRMELIDLTGKVIRTYSNINSNKTEINCNQLNSGLYLLKIYADKVYVRKVIVE